MLLGIWTLILWSVLIFLAGWLFGKYVMGKVKKNLK